MSNKPDPKMEAILKHMELRKEYEQTCEIRIGDAKDNYIKHLETLVLAYRERYGAIDITPKV